MTVLPRKGGGPLEDQGPFHSDSSTSSYTERKSFSYIWGPCLPRIYELAPNIQGLSERGSCTLKLQKAYIVTRGLASVRHVGVILPLNLPKSHEILI